MTESGWENIDELDEPKKIKWIVMRKNIKYQALLQRNNCRNMNKENAFTPAFV